MLKYRVRNTRKVVGDGMYLKLVRDEQSRAGKVARMVLKIKDR